MADLPNFIPNINITLSEYEDLKRSRNELANAFTNKEGHVAYSPTYAHRSRWREEGYSHWVYYVDKRDEFLAKLVRANERMTQALVEIENQIRGSKSVESDRIRSITNELKYKD